MTKEFARVLLAAAIATVAAAAQAQSVALGGNLGSRALLVIDGKPKQVAVGEMVDGVRLVSIGADGAVVDIKGKRVPLALGGAPVSLGGTPSEGGGDRIVLTADLGGHFYSAGNINGRPVRFIVDTGATNIAISQSDADRIGLDYKSGERGLSSTANGVVPIHRVTLASVRVGDVQIYNVQAIVLPGTMSHVLLGNSFLNRFQMRRENTQLTLDRRY